MRFISMIPAIVLLLALIPFGKNLKAFFKKLNSLVKEQPKNYYAHSVKEVEKEINRHIFYCTICLLGSMYCVMYAFNL